MLRHKSPVQVYIGYHKVWRIVLEWYDWVGSVISFGRFILFCFRFDNVLKWWFRPWLEHFQSYMNMSCDVKVSWASLCGVDSRRLVMKPRESSDTHSWDARFVVSFKQFSVSPSTSYTNDSLPSRTWSIWRHSTDTISSLGRLDMLGSKRTARSCLFSVAKGRNCTEV